MTRWRWLPVLVVLLSVVVCGGAWAADVTDTATVRPGAPETTSREQTASDAPFAVRVAVIGVPGLEWGDVDEFTTPNLWRLVGEGGAGSLSTRTVPPPDRSITCPVAGWLTVSAGQRAGAPGSGCGLPPLPQPTGDGGAVVPGWDTLVAFNAEQSYQARLGTLGAHVTASGGKVAAVGPGAAMGAADASGRIDAYSATVETLDDPRLYHLIVMEADDIAKAWIEGGVDADGEPIPPSAEERAQAARAADRRIGALLDRLPENTAVLVAGLSDASRSAHLHVAVAAGPSPSGEPYGGLLTSPSTRQDALVTLTDLTATAVRLLGLEPPDGVVGRPWSSVPADGRNTAGVVAERTRADVASQVLSRVRAPFFTAFVAVQVIFYALAALAVRRRRGGRKVLVATQVMAVCSGAIGISTFLAQLVPWWHTGVPMTALVTTIVGFAALIAAVAFAGPWRTTVLGPLTVVAGISSIGLLLEAMAGSYLQVNAVTGYDPVTGARFYGYGNIAFAVLATGTIMFLTGIAQPLLARGRTALALAVCAGYGGLAVFADGWPAWGADFGGVLSFIPGLAVFLFLLSGKRVSAARLALVGLATAAFITLISFLDWLRPAADRTHLGAFFQQVLDGEAWPVIGRKFGAMVGTLGNLPLTILSLVALAFLFLVLARPSRWGVSALTLAYERAPALRAGLFGVLTCGLIGFLVNDSGIAIPSMALTVAVPLTLAASVRALLLAGRGDATPTPRERSSGSAESTARPAP